jgi:hypothetical protein
MQPHDSSETQNTNNRRIKHIFASFDLPRAKAKWGEKCHIQSLIIV